MAPPEQLTHALDGDESVFRFGGSRTGSPDSTHLVSLVTDDSAFSMSIPVEEDGTQISEGSKEETNLTTQPKQIKLEGKPRRPLSGYNLFFKMMRERIINDSDKELTPEEITNFKIETNPVRTKRRHRKTHGKIGFRELARTIAEKWRKLDPECKVIFENRAAEERQRYLVEIEQWKRMNKKGKGKRNSGRDHPDVVSIATEDDFSSQGNDIYGSHMSNGSAFATFGHSKNYTQQELMSVAAQNGKNLPALMRESLYLARLNQNIAEQKQLQSELRQASMERMHTMPPEHCGTSHQYMGYVKNQYQDPQMPYAGDYYDMADQVYNLAQVTLPMSPNQMMHSGRSDGYDMMATQRHQTQGSHSVTPGNVPYYQTEPMAESSSSQFIGYGQEVQQQNHHHPAMQRQTFVPLPLDQPHTTVDDVLRADVHQDLSTPTFEIHAKQEEDAEEATRSVFDSSFV